MVWMGDVGIGVVVVVGGWSDDACLGVNFTAAHESKGTLGRMVKEGEGRDEGKDG